MLTLVRIGVALGVAIVVSLLATWAVDGYFSYGCSFVTHQDAGGNFITEPTCPDRTPEMRALAILVAIVTFWAVYTGRLSRLFRRV